MHVPPREGFVSVVIVTKNDPRVVACVDSVLAQQVPVGFDVTVVDGSDDGSDAVLAVRYDHEPRVNVRRDRQQFLAAWNAGARATRGDIVVRLDSDMVAPPGWLAALVEPLLRSQEVGWTAGLVVGPTPLASLTQRYFHYRTLGFLLRNRRTRDASPMAPSWNVAYRRRALEQAGYFDPWLRSSEDWDLHHRLVRAGFLGRFVEAAVLVHDHPRRLRTFFRKERWYKQGQYQLALKYGVGRFAGIFALPLVYLLIWGLLVAGLVLPVLTLVGGALWLLLAIKQCVGAWREGDRVFWARPFYRTVEALAGLVGLLQAMLRFGLRRPTHL